uniref:ATP-dependent RNA helicase SUV3 DEXQ-box helicase domain-containing protein n=1 Tax=Timema poppense TaxID=170557 RepID=A0A7R9DAM6_TIMPO|nr:unnamed protein product [Timema poppensis]
MLSDSCGYSVLGSRLMSPGVPSASVWTGVSNVRARVTSEQVGASAGGSASPLFVYSGSPPCIVCETSDICCYCGHCGTPCDLVTGEERKYATNEDNISNHVSCTVEMTSINVPSFSDMSVQIKEIGETYPIIRQPASTGNTNASYYQNTPTQPRVEYNTEPRLDEVAIIDEIQMMRDTSRGWAWTRALLGVMAEEIHVCGEDGAVDLVHSLMSTTGEHVEVMIAQMGGFS